MSDSVHPLEDLALLTLVVAHGTDAELDARETRALVHQLALMEPRLGHGEGAFDLGEWVHRAVEAYGALSVVELDDVVARLGDALDGTERTRALEALIRVAQADGVFHTMERTFLRHVAQVWGVTKAGEG